MTRPATPDQLHSEHRYRQAAQVARFLRSHGAALHKNRLIEYLLTHPEWFESPPNPAWDGRFFYQQDQVGLWEWQYPFAPKGDPVVAIDIETTGLSPGRDRVIEVAMVRYEAGQQYTLAQLVNPHTEVPAFITRLTGIKTRDVRQAPDLPEVLRQAIPLLDGATLVLHNASFDLSFLKPEFLQLGYILKHKVIDTLRWSRSALPGLSRRNLDALIRAFDLEDSATRHRALADAEATLALAREMYYVLTAGQPRPLGEL